MRGAFRSELVRPKETLETVMDGLLSGSEIDGILARRDLILACRFRPAHLSFSVFGRLM